MMKKIKSELQKYALIIGFVHKYKKSLILELIVKSCLEASTPFLSYILTGIIVDNLANLTKNNVNDLLWSVLTFSCLILFISVLLNLISHHITLVEKDMNYLIKENISERSRTIDYTSLVDSETRNELTKALEGSINYGGIVMFTSTLGAVFKCIIQVAYSLIILLQLLYSSRNDISIYLLLLIAIAITIVFVSNIYVNFKNAKTNYGFYEKNIDNYRKENYFKTLLFNRDIACDIRIYNIKPLIINRISTILNSYREYLKEAFSVLGKRSGLLQGGNQIFSFIIYLSVAIIAYNSNLSASFVILICGSLIQFIGGLGAFCVQLVDLTMHSNYLIHYCRFMNNTNVRSEKNGLEDQPVNFEIEFKNVSFAYPDSADLVLDDISFCISNNKKIALVGENGSGKSTIVALLCKFYKPQKGVILLNGKDINCINDADYYKCLSVVFQDFEIFSLSIQSNISFTNTPDTNKIINIFKGLNLYSKIKENHFMLNDIIGNDYSKGINMSGGELQKIAIARAIYKNSRLVILDEPTSAIDAISEMNLYENIDKIVGKKSVLYISHRMASCKFCDLIIVLKHGRIVQTGTHSQLVKIEGEYRKLWISQAELYRS